jgi:hypothetical protein
MPRIHDISTPTNTQRNATTITVHQQAFGHLDDVVAAFADLKRLLHIEPNNKAGRQLVQRLKERAAEKSTVRFQILEKLKATGQEPAERLKNLRQVLGSLNEDADLGKEIMRGDGLQVLWDTASDMENGEPFATIVLARLCEDKADVGVAKAIADIVNPAVVLGWAKDLEVRMHTFVCIYAVMLFFNTVRYSLHQPSKLSRTLFILREGVAISCSCCNQTADVFFVVVDQ